MHNPILNHVERYSFGLTPGMYSMSTFLSHRLMPAAVPFAAMVMASCAPASEPETAASPVEAVTRSSETIRGQYGDAYNRRGDDGTVVAKVVAPAPAVWEALLATMVKRQVTPSVFDRPTGRMGDTALVMLRRWNGQHVSYYFNCGSSMTGPRADDDRVKAVLLAQLTRLKADTIGIAVHLSAMATSISGTSSTPAQCMSTGRGEAEILDEVIRSVGGAGRRS